TLASGSTDRTIRLWDAVTGAHRRTLTGHTSSVISVAFSPDGITLASGCLDGTVLLWELSPTAESPLLGDVNHDGVVNAQDLVIVAARFGQRGQNNADVNGDGVINIFDLVTIASMLGNTVAAPSVQQQALAELTAAEVEDWLTQAQQMALTDPVYRRGIAVLEQLLAALTPKETILLPNYPNPFNPETWIPYHLAHAADVEVTIYDTKGVIVRQLDIGHQPAGYYMDRTKTAYWDGCNESGESVASGVYFYQLRAGDYSATRRMITVK
ncbi:T9SS type A sorting domain-containing protein, partial [Candidatus Poribacteria bacterium]|nr:T9SS type A sorting domain-containing protein [Candidatus Poribacteria bacterium]